MDPRIRSFLWRLRRLKAAISTFVITTFLVTLIILTPPPIPDVSLKSYCSETPSLYYVKVHKTGSTTFQNILLRFGMQRDLFFALFHCDYGMPYPNTPNDTFLQADPTHPQFQGRFQLLTDHAVFNTEVIKSYMPPDTPVVTLLRHPLDQLVSTIGFFKLTEKFGIEAESTQEAIKVYLEDPERYEQLTDYAGCQSSSNYSQTRNPQSHHLGLRNQSIGDQGSIQRFIQDIDRKLSLVLILEKFEESLLLFRRMFCFSTRDILHLNLFSQAFVHRKVLRKSNKLRQHQITKDITEQQEMRDSLISKHQSWSTADYLLYSYYLHKHNSLVQKLGKEFQEELESFRKIKDLVRTFCAESCGVFEELKLKPVHTARQRIYSDILEIERTNWNEDFTISRADCLLMMMGTAVYSNAIKLKQWPEICSWEETDESDNRTSRRFPRLNNRLHCDYTTDIVPHVRWESVRYSAYFNKGLCLAQF